MEHGSGAIHLAHEAEFALGAATVRPALSEVSTTRAKVRLQPRVMQVLVVLAVADGAVVSRDDLLARCWTGASVGEDALNRCIQRLRRLSLESPGCFHIETIARVGYRLERAGDAAGVMAAPTRDQHFSAGRRSQTAAAPTGVSLGRVVAFTAIALLAGGATWLSALRPRYTGSGGPKVSIVVAPLDVRAADVPARIVQTGLSSDLARALVANPLQVAIAVPGPNAARPPGRLILDGSAFTIGSDLQAQLRLKDAPSQEILWSKSFTGAASAANILRERAALKIGAVLNCALHTRQSADVTKDAERLYLSACDDIGDSNAKAALAKLRRITLITPRFAQAWAELAATVATTAQDLQPAEQAVAYSEAARDAQRALSLDPRTGLAYFALFQANPGVHNWSRRKALLEAGLRAEPEAANLDNLMGDALLQVGRSSEAVVYFQRAVDLDPLSPVKAASLIAALTDAGRFGEAEQAIIKASRVWSQDPRIWSRYFYAEARLGDPNRAERLIEDPNRPLIIDPADVARWKSRLRYRRHPSAILQSAAIKLVQPGARAPGVDEELERAYELAALNRIDLAYEVLMPAAGGLTQDAESLLFRSELRAFRADRRFMTLAKRLGLVAIWRSSGRWPDFCTDADAPYDCAATAARAPD